MGCHQHSWVRSKIALPLYTQNSRCKLVASLPTLIFSSPECSNISFGKSECNAACNPAALGETWVSQGLCSFISPIASPRRRIFLWKHLYYFSNSTPVCLSYSLSVALRFSFSKLPCPHLGVSDYFAQMETFTFFQTKLHCTSHFNFWVPSETDGFTCLQGTCSSPIC